MISENTIVKRPQHIMAKEVKGDMVVLNLESEQYFGLDEVGKDMWLALTTSQNTEEALQKLLQMYDVEREQLERDFVALLSNFVDEGLLELTIREDS